MESEIILFFDGECFICNYSVRIIEKLDAYNQFKYTSLSSNYTKENHPLLRNQNSVVVFFKDKYFYESEAVLLMLGKSYWPFRIISMLFSFVPKRLRNYLYQFIARNRYRFFKKVEHCSLLDSSTREKLIE
ncbi:DCC1-like thiol-disulfide oxidoreductase family protein [Bacteriovoracaceae bacterium]|nr:DCC1-like thiol-disulfide oxidoreductase family protein [Bacteriovoracaceae bacterium]